MKIWCAAGVNLLGGYTRDGGLMVGGSVFYYDDPMPLPKPVLTDVETLDKELNAGREGAILETQLSSLVWICTSTKTQSAVHVIDANNPADVLKTFNVCQNHLLCIASVPGASAMDYMDGGVQIHENIDEDNVDPENMVGRVTYVECELPSTSIDDVDITIETDTSRETDEAEESKETVDEAEEKTEEDENVNREKDKMKNWERKGRMSSVLATMWLGAQNGMLYVHSAVANWDQCIHSVQLKDAILSIV